MTTDIVARDRATIAKIIFIVVLGRADEQKSASIIVTIIINDGRAARVEVGIEALTIIACAGKGGFVELNQAVIGAPLPNARIVARRTAARVAYDIMLDKCAIGAPWHDAISTDVLQIIVPDHDIVTGIP